MVVLEVVQETAEVELEPIVSSILERRMQLAETQQMDGGMLWMEFREQYRLQYEAAIVKLDQKNGNVSGDNSSKICDRKWRITLHFKRWNGQRRESG